MTDNSSAIRIRHASMDDLEVITELEALCFPETEAATRDSFARRLQTHSECFWLLELDGCVQ